MIEDAFDVRRAYTAPGLLRAFNDAGVLAAADVHVARRLAALGGVSDDAVVLAAALAARGPRVGHVYVDLATIRDTATVDAEDQVDLAALPWPDQDAWAEGVAGSGLAGVGEEDGDAHPLRLLGTRLYLDRYWREERQVAADLRALATAAPALVRIDVLAAGLARLFPAAGDASIVGAPPAGDASIVGPRPAADAGQRLAAAAAVLSRFAVVAGGPGTGKTTTVARIVALLAEQAAADGAQPPLVALAAPTGKAAARLAEAVHDEAATLDVAAPVRALLDGLEASTLHRLLGWRADSHSRFRHHRANTLPHDVVIVDETSMISLSLMARLVEAVRPGARLILVGDPGQLTSIEAGAVLGDVVGPAADGPRMRPEASARLMRATGEALPDNAPDATPIGDGIVVLGRVHRFGSGIAALATAVRSGDADATIAVLAAAPEGMTWLPVDVDEPYGAASGAVGTASREALAPVRHGAVAAARAVMEAAEAGDGTRALGALGAFRLLCAHREGPYGVGTWTRRVETWLAEAVPGFRSGGAWYAGRPLLMTENDYGLQLYNGDTGVVVATGAGELRAAFARRGELLELLPSRLGAVDTVYAMTVHKSQGSQFDTAAVLLPAPTSRVLTRELLYTAVTRAREGLILAGTEATIRAAVARPAARASGLRERLWG